MDLSIRDIFRKIVGGDEERFFRDYWRKRTLFTESALPCLQSFYDLDQFVRDYHELGCHDSTLVISVDKEKKRRMLHVTQSESVDSALARGMSVVVQALLLPKNISIPEKWQWFIDLHRGFCDYIFPAFPAGLLFSGPVAAVDLFCTLSESCSGGHYDTGDVFYFALSGEKEWSVESVSDFENGHRLASESNKSDLLPRGEHMEINVRPGDCLYVPPYTYHRVRSTGPTLAVSLGLPTHTGLSLLRASLIEIQKEKLLHLPLLSYPRDHDMLFRLAEEATRERIIRAVDLLKGTALGIG